MVNRYFSVPWIGPTADARRMRLRDDGYDPKEGVMKKPTMTGKGWFGVLAAALGAMAGLVVWRRRHHTA